MNGVRTPVGSSSATSTPKPATSARSASERLLTAYLLMWYAPAKGEVKSPPTLPTFTTLPAPLAPIPGRTSWLILSIPNTLTSNSSRTASHDSSSTGPYRA